MTYAMEPINSDSEVSDGEEILEQRIWTPKRIGLVAFGLTCVVASALAGAFALRKPTYPKLTARSLLETNAMIAAVAKNQIAMMNLQDDEPEVQMKVAQHMKKLEEEMKGNEPARWRELNDLVLQPHHVKGLLGVVNSMRDPRVQELGRKVVQAFADGRSAGRVGVHSQLSR